MKKVLSLLLVVMLIFSLAACSQNNNQTPTDNSNKTTDEPKTTDDEQKPADDEQKPADDEQKPADSGKPYKAALLLNGNLGDKSFYDSANEGLTKLKEELGEDKFDFKVEQMGATPADESKWGPTLLDYCERGEYDVLIMGTWQMTEHLAEAAEQYPEQKFIFFDEGFPYEDYNNPENIYNVLYKQNEVSYLVGAAAAMMTVDESIPGIDPSNKLIGFLGGMDNVVINDFLVGYIQGATDIDPETKVAVGFVGNFYDSAVGKDLSLSQYDQGVDVGYNVAGGAGLGQIDAAVDVKKYAFGVDSDQGALMPDKQPYIPSSALKNVGNSLIRAIKLDLEGKLEYGKAETLGFAEGGVEMVMDDHYNEFMPESIKTKLAELEQDIIDGKVVVDSAVGKSTEEIQEIISKVKPE